MNRPLSFPRESLPRSVAPLRAELRAFLDAERAAGHFVAGADSWMNASPAFSRKLGARGWLGMTWPRAYGGGERSALERYVVTEELLTAGAPVGAHWISDRQTGPMLLRFGTEEQRLAFMPRIARGECYFAIGMSEPDAGSDLAAVRTRAERVEGGWKLTGRKVWTSFAHEAHAMIVLCRTAPRDEQQRHAGLSQLLVELHWPGITMRPILNLAGEHHFNEVVFDEVFVPDARVVGQIGEGWKQVIGELAFERSGPERFLSYFPLLPALIAGVAPRARVDDRASAAAVGALVTQLAALRQMSISVAGRLQAGESPEIEAAVVKDLGTRLERQLPEQARHIAALNDLPLHEGDFGRLLAETLYRSPSATLRGGTNEILRGAVARAMGLR
jgi:alkylation response protein AidB-like acyl-CoA dehydrogenase